MFKTKIIHLAILLTLFSSIFIAPTAKADINYSAYGASLTAEIFADGAKIDITTKTGKTPSPKEYCQLAIEQIEEEAEKQKKLRDNSRSSNRYDFYNENHKTLTESIQCLKKLQKAR